MTRTQTLLVTTAMALALPLASAIAQTASTTTKCGPVAWSTEKMAYSSAPCAGGEAAGVVGTSGPTAFGANNSTSMTKAEMKQGQTATYYPAQAQAVASGPNMAPMNDQCGPSNAATITDEYGRKYNCRGDRIRR
jgi:hypothetical protein